MSGTQGVSGYRQLLPEEVALINQIKAHGAVIETLINKLYKMPQCSFNVDGYPEGNVHITIDKRWAAIGKTHMQEGFMALVRSVAKPQGF